jgi:hypothetical protein
MTRGRQKDTTLPQSRALIVQRAYRDRKAKYIADLEDRCRKAEEENVRLKEELALARSQSPLSHTAIKADLVIQTGLRICSLFDEPTSRLKLAQIWRTASRQRRQPYRSSSSGRLYLHPSQTSKSQHGFETRTVHSFLFRTIPSATELDIAAVLTHALRQDLPALLSQQPKPSDTHPSPGDSSDTECCGGVIDCQGLVE